MSREARGRLLGHDGRPTRAVVLVDRADLPDCWARGWCSETCKTQALEALARGELVAPIPSWPHLAGN